MTQTKMRRQPVEAPSFTVIGLTTRTNNQLEMTGVDGKIGPLWQAYFQGGAARIPSGPEDGIIYSLYTGYASDHTGDYDVILGRAVHDGDKAPADTDTSRVRIPAARYLVFPAANPTPEGIMAAWNSVYQYFADSFEQRRAFTVDFERHSKQSVELYIAIQ